MKIGFFGANRQVTGSRHFLQTNGVALMVDYGMFQQRPYLDRNWEPSPVPPADLNAVLLTHAHLDHCGLLPRLVAEGFTGRILATPVTTELAEIILRDSAHTQVEDAAFKRKRHRKERRRGKHPEVPLYTEREVERVLPLLEKVPYDQTIELGRGVQVRFFDAGHILGSAIVEVCTGGDRPRRLLFSGDLGRENAPIVRDATLFAQADYVVMESTYGDRDHPPADDIPEQLARVINDAVSRGGNVVIPVFALERSQEVLYHLAELIRQRRIPPLPVFLDSPMAIAITQVFRRHPECYDEAAWALLDAGETVLGFPGLQLTRTVEQSKAINQLKEPAVILASSGMCTAGRVKHHLVHNITRPESTILFVGYQAAATLGRQIVDGRPEVRIHGRPWPVRARVDRIPGFSGHADRSSLIEWLAALESPPRKLFLVHGEESSSMALAEQLRQSLGFSATIPEYGQQFELD